MLFQYWPTANGAGPTLKQYRIKSSSLQVELSAFRYTPAVCVWLEQTTQCSVYHGCVKGVVNCQNLRDKGPPEGNSARG